MSQAKQGDTVKVHYTGKLDDGTVFDSSREREPLEFTIGEGRVIPGFEAAVEGMSTGETQTARVEPDNAYGQHRPDMVITVDPNQFPPSITPEIGQRLQVSDPQGQTFDVTVTDISPESVTLDANHPLAGKDLVFEIELVEVVD
ncbi:MAG: peptidylprolyl isomerase [Chloroflexi bacterium]|nr:peptidylprolyl isomerase [Chloroflexota bacterium]